jgi:hypothetical protein
MIAGVDSERSLGGVVVALVHDHELEVVASTGQDGAGAGRSMIRPISGGDDRRDPRGHVVAIAGAS